METIMGWGTLLTGILIFAARVVDVSLGTMRTISTVHGRTAVSFCLGLVEITIWIYVITAVVAKIGSEPLLGVFYALGYSTGNVVGIKLERRLAFGHMVLRVFSLKKGHELAEKVREQGFAVTTFEGEGRSGPVTELYIVCRRRDMRKLINLVTLVEPEAFYITEQAGDVSKIYRSMMVPATGWRAVFKKK